VEDPPELSEYEKLRERNIRERDEAMKEAMEEIDPGVNPDPRLHWMAKINCPNQTEEQNLVGFQLAGQIYYRVMMDIPCARELLVWYGTTYAEEMGIDVTSVDKYKGEEDHTKEAVKCEYCGSGMEGEEELEKHLGKGDRYVYRCGVKQAMEMVRMAESGERKHVCKECGKGFKTKQDLSRHNPTHSNVKAYKCDVEGCDKSFASAGNMSTHKRTIHEGVYHECPECGKRFGKKGNMRRHYKDVHGEEKQYKCAKCGLQFSQNSDLKRHIKTVHEMIRAFKCEHCKKSFSLAGNRKKHIEIVHSNIRYPCT
jgi:DNA-directed RNA polymerase subunit RPC12/RpoP